MYWDLGLDLYMYWDLGLGMDMYRDLGLDLDMYRDLGLDMDMYWEYGRNTIAFAYPKGRDKSPNLAIRSGAWKLLMNHDGSDTQLYNIDKDPDESSDVIKKFPKVADELKEKLRKWCVSLPKLGEDGVTPKNG